MRTVPDLDLAVPYLDTELRLALPRTVLEAIARRAAAIVAESLSTEPQAFIGVEQAAEHLACKPQRIYDLVSQGRLGCHRDGRRLLFRRPDLDAYLARTASRG
jgi:excisionase family DNA binding protein